MRRSIIIAVIMAFSLAGCATARGEWVQTSGKYFKVMMPGKAETKHRKIEQLAALGDMYSTTYLYETDDKAQTYAVMEMDWSELISGIEETSGPDDAIKERFANEIIAAFGGVGNAAPGAATQPPPDQPDSSDIFSASSTASIIGAGGMKGLKVDMAALSEYGLGLEGDDITADVYMVPTDQAIILLIYGGTSDGYDESNGKDFFASFEGVNTTTDIIGF